LGLESFDFKLKTSFARHSRESGNPNITVRHSRKSGNPEFDFDLWLILMTSDRRLFLSSNRLFIAN